MPRGDELDADALRDLDLTPIADGMEAGQRTLRVGCVIQRQCRMMLRIAVPVGLPCVLLLNLGGIRQDELAQIPGAGSAKRTPLEAVGRYPTWSRCAWVSTTASIDPGGSGKSSQLRRRNSLSPWNSPQSNSTRRPLCVSRYFDPVTVRAAPRNVSRVTVLTISGFGFDRSARDTGC
jgi:hypothetical protein